MSFGHAAYFGLGAYGAALPLTSLGAAHGGGAAARARGRRRSGRRCSAFFVVRLSGIYLAMLTLAAAQILYAVAFQWVEVTGGDNGIVGVWPSRLGRRAASPITISRSRSRPRPSLALRHVIYAPFGYALARRARFRIARRRDRPRRARAPLARLHARRRRGGARRRALRLLEGLGRPERFRHPDLGRCARHAACSAASNRHGAARRRGGAAHAARIRSCRSPNCGA